MHAVIGVLPRAALVPVAMLIAIGKRTIIKMFERDAVHVLAVAKRRGETAI